MVVVLFGGYFVVRKWKREEMQKKAKRAKGTVRNQVTSIDDLVTAIDRQESVTAEKEKPHHAAAPVVKRYAITETLASQWLKAATAELAALVDAHTSAQAAQESIGNLGHEYRSKYSAVTEPSRPYIGDEVYTFEAAVNGLLRSETRLLELQELICALPSQVQAAQAALKAAMKLLKQRLQRLERISDQHLPVRVRAMRRLISCQLSKSKALDSALSKVSGDAKRQARGLRSYQKPSGQANETETSAEARILECINSMLELWTEVSELRDSYRSEERQYEKLHEGMQDLAGHAPGYFEANLLESSLADYIEKFVRRQSYRNKLNGALRVALVQRRKALQDSIENLGALLRIAPSKPRTSRYAMVRKVAEFWHRDFLDRVHSITVSPQDETVEFGDEHCPQIESLVAEFTTVLNEINIHRKILEGLQREYETLADDADRKCPVDAPDFVTASTLAEYFIARKKWNFEHWSALERATRKLMEVNDVIKILDDLTVAAAGIPQRIVDVLPQSPTIEDYAAYHAVDAFFSEYKRALQNTLKRRKADELKTKEEVERSEEIAGLAARCEGLIKTIGELIDSSNVTITRARDAQEEVSRMPGRTSVAVPLKPADADVVAYLDEMRAQGLTILEATESARELKDLAIATFDSLKSTIYEFEDVLAELLAHTNVEVNPEDFALIKTLESMSALLVGVPNEHQCRLDKIAIESRLPVVAEDTETTTDDPALTNLRTAERSLVFAVIQRNIAQCKLTQAEDLPVPASPCRPELPDGTQMDVDFLALIDATVAFNEETDRIQTRRSENQEAISRALEALETRRKTVKDRVAATKELMQSIRTAASAGITAALLEELNAAQLLCAATK
jgi:hypothetical protein